MNFHKYIEEAKIPSTFKSTGMKKNYYLDVIEFCVKAYDKDSIEKRLPEKGGFVDDLQAYSRLACGIAALLSNGRIPEYKDLWFSMMDALCNDFHRRTPPNTLDFAVKETMLAFKAMKPFTDREKQRYWLGLLGKIDPFKCYTSVDGNQTWNHIRNWNIYAMAGHYLIETEGAADSKELFERHWQHQFKFFDENGMYMDPHNPMLYDLTTRVQAQLITGYGYTGRYAKKLEEELEKGALASLFYQSASGEFPYGGRSNQYLFNESLLTANFEYEAYRAKKNGNLKLAGMYKRAAHLAIQSIERWLKADDGARHIKNFYPRESKYGTESYGYFDKYMMSMGCFLYIGYPFADDTIEEFPCPAELGGYVFKTSDAFHKIFANCSSYSLEIDTSADFLYDSSGLGRIHKTGTPTEIALSAPFSKLHQYTTEGCDNADIALCPGWKSNGSIMYLSEASNSENHSLEYLKDSFKSEEDFLRFKNSFHDGLSVELKIITETIDSVSFELTYSGKALDGIDYLTELYSITKKAITVETRLFGSLENEIYYSVPAFFTNGKDASTISCTNTILTVKSMGFEFTAATDGVFEQTPGLFGNRNGKYRCYTAKKESNQIKMVFKIKQPEETK